MVLLYLAIPHPLAPLRSFCVIRNPLSRRLSVHDSVRPVVLTALGCALSVFALSMDSMLPAFDMLEEGMDLSKDFHSCTRRHYFLYK
jgi:hypothetical protein